MRIKNAIAVGALFICVVVSVGCINTYRPPAASALPASELRAIQTRTYDGMDLRYAMKTVVDVLQDDGYIVDYGNMELGIIHATKETDLGGEAQFSTGRQFFNENESAGQIGAARFDATVNLTEEFANKIKIRVSLQRNVPQIVANIAYLGTSVPYVVPHAGTIVDAKTYQEFFATLDRGVFLHKQGL